MKEKYKVSQYYIAYFDILGYKAFFDDQDNDMDKLLETVIAISEDVERTTSSDGAFNQKFQIKAFSDNFMIMLEAENIDEYQAVKTLSYLVGLMQLRFLEKYSILIRGSITKGLVYINDRIVFGEGLIKSVELEEGAIFPRIVVDETRIKKDVCEDLCEKCLSFDSDNRYYVDFFDVIGKQIGGDCYYGDNEEEKLNIIRINIIKLIKSHGKYNRMVKDIRKITQAERTISKYLWLLTKYNEFCCFQYEKFIIKYDLVLYPRLMKSEISFKKK